METLVIDLKVPRSEYLRVYRSYVRSVHAVSRDGRTVRFPVAAIQPHVTHEGVYGCFQLRFEKLRLVSFTRAPETQSVDGGRCDPILESRAVELSC